METRLAAWAQESSDGRRADEILRSCVHCGFCLATCPTYQLLGDELDSPRGRIYQIKQVLEGQTPTRETQLHLDRCLTCRSCETTCPSGVQYGQLVDIGRAVVDERVMRPWRERAYRWALREGVSRAWVFGTALRLGRMVRWALPAALRAKVSLPRPPGPLPTRALNRKILLIGNCAQTSMLPSIDAATMRVLDMVGIQSLVTAGSGCCGAIRQHLDDHAGALGNVRRNIDAWWPLVESNQVEAILSNASGCGAMVKDYGRLLRDDPAYAWKAARVTELTRDLAEFVPEELMRFVSRPGGLAGQAARLDQGGARDPGGAPISGDAPIQGSSPHRGVTADQANASSPTDAPSQRVVRAPRRVAFHPPCTLQHGLRVRGKVESLLVALGADLVPVRDAHICCGSAGTYSLLQPELSQTLRGQKLQNLLERQPEIVLSANIGCISHLQGGTRTPVWHWIEWVDAAWPGDVANRQD